MCCSPEKSLRCEGHEEVAPPPVSRGKPAAAAFCMEGRSVFLPRESPRVRAHAGRSPGVSLRGSGTRTVLHPGEGTGAAGGTRPQSGDTIIPRIQMDPPVKHEGRGWFPLGRIHLPVRPCKEHAVSQGDFHLNALWQNALKKLLTTRGKLWKTC